MKREDWMYEKWNEAQNKLDYFVAGTALASFGYAATHISVSPPIGANEIVQVASVVSLFLASLLSYWRIEEHVYFLKTTGNRVHAEEEIVRFREFQGKGMKELLRGRIYSPSEIAEMIREHEEDQARFLGEEVRIGKRMDLLYVTRNVMVLAGLAGFGYAKAAPVVLELVSRC